MEDEFHFITTCSYYKNLRKELMSSLIELYPNVNLLSTNMDMLFIYLMTSEGVVSQLVGKFCSEAFDARTYAREFMIKSPKSVVTRVGRKVVRPKILDL